MKYFLFFIIITYSFLSCSYKKEKSFKVTELGEIGFRKSYAGHEHWSEAELDSVMKLSPEFDRMDTPATKMLAVLKSKGIVRGNTLILEKLYETLKDSLQFAIPGQDTITVTTNFNEKLEMRVVQVSQKGLSYQLPIQYCGLDKTMFAKIEMPDSSYKFLAYSGYYFMNGDMFSLLVFTVE